MKNCNCAKVLLDNLSRFTSRPALFELGEALFWDDPHISKSMLAAHLAADSDGASRSRETIEKTVNHLISTATLQQDDTVLDLGCGPGLYSNRLCRYGMAITGIDISERSIEYARKVAREQGLNSTYLCGNFFDLDYDCQFDRVLQIYGEMSTFSDQARNRLLQIIHKALKDDGLFIFDVSTRNLRMREGLKNRWYFAEEGFWRPHRHAVLELGFDYPEDDIWLDQYIVIDETGNSKTYRLWFHDYSLVTITEALNENGFALEQVWGDLTGTTYESGNDWIAIVAKKV